MAAPNANNIQQNITQPLGQVLGDKIESLRTDLTRQTRQIESVETDLIKRINTFEKTIRINIATR